MTASSRITELTSEACRRLLGEHSLGRLGVVLAGKPFIFPVNYVFESDTVVFRTDPGTKLAGSGFQRAVFEIDGVDQSRGEGWSVIVSGVSREINDALDVLAERLRSLHVDPWVPGERAHWVALQAESITGRLVAWRGCEPRPYPSPANRAQDQLEATATEKGP